MRACGTNGSVHKEPLAQAHLSIGSGSAQANKLCEGGRVTLGRSPAGGGGSRGPAKTARAERTPNNLTHAPLALPRTDLSLVGRQHLLHLYRRKSRHSAQLLGTRALPPLKQGDEPFEDSGRKAWPRT